MPIQPKTNVGVENGREVKKTKKTEVQEAKQNHKDQIYRQSKYKHGIRNNSTLLMLLFRALYALL